MVVVVVGVVEFVFVFFVNARYLTFVFCQLPQYGANPSTKDNKGLSPLAVARSILLEGASHKGLKPKDRDRGKKQFPEIKKLMLDALIEQQQRDMGEM